MKKLHVLIVALPGAWQQVLQKSIETCAFANLIGCVSGSLSAIQLANRVHPDLVLIDSSIPFDDAIVLIQKLKTDIPETASIVVADTSQQRQRLSQSGADYTVSTVNYDAHIHEILGKLGGNLLGEKSRSDETGKTSHQAD